MKKITTLSAVTLFSFLLFSCQKESINRLTSAPGPASNTINPASNVKIVSSWFRLQLNYAMTRDIVYLMGQHYFDSYINYDKNEHVELAYFRNMSQNPRDPLSYSSIPTKINKEYAGAHYTYSLDFSLNFSSFSLSIKNTDPLGPYPSANQFGDLQYRYIIIPKATYESLNIDWNNYLDVAQGLNFTP